MVIISVEMHSFSRLKFVLPLQNYEKSIILESGIHLKIVKHEFKMLKNMDINQVHILQRLKNLFYKFLRE